MIELTFQKVLILIRELHQKSVIFAGIVGSKFQLSVCNVCHDVSMMSMTLNNIAILNICDVDYCFVINGISNISN